MIAGVILSVLLLFDVYMFIRNDWVCGKRVALIWSDPALYKSLPDYWEMLFKFWIWDVEKFIGKNKIAPKIT